MIFIFSFLAITVDSTGSGNTAYLACPLMTNGASSDAAPTYEKVILFSLTLLFCNISLNTISGVRPFPVLYISHPSKSNKLSTSSVDTKYNDPHPIVPAIL